MDIPTVGRFATIMDPQGATLSLITYAKGISANEKAIRHKTEHVTSGLRPGSNCSRRRRS